MNIIHYLAIKLSTISANDITIREVLQSFNRRVLIDAEHSRLDQWLVEQMDKGLISIDEMSRLLITVQGKRADARDQLVTLQDIGARVALVRGHSSYLGKTEIVSDAIHNIFKLQEEFDNIEYFGINTQLQDELYRRFSWKPNVSKILGLYGGDPHHASWVYLVGDRRSDEAQAFQRRQGIDSTISSFGDLITMQSAFLYIDIISRENYLDLLHYYNKSCIIEKYPLITSKLP